MPFSFFPSPSPDPYTTYKFWLKAFTWKNEGQPSSPPYEVTTDVRMPEAPIVTNLACKDASSLYVEWENNPTGPGMNLSFSRICDDCSYCSRILTFGAPIEYFESINARMRRETPIIPGHAANPGVKGKPKGSRPPIDFYFVSYHSQSERNRYQTVTLDRQSIAFQEKRVRPFLRGLSVKKFALGFVKIVHIIP